MSKRECRKCGLDIPKRIKVEGKYKNLQNRKFCLTCSPFKSHNTSPYDPNDRRKGDSFKSSSEEYKRQVTLSLYKRALTRKFELIEQLGGKCKQCSYNRSWRALSFHHKDPSEKCFGLSLDNLWCNSMEIIQKEVDKCELLCLNCHAELGRETKFDIVAEVNKKYGTNF